MKKRMYLLGLVLLAACALPAADRKLIQTGADVGQGNLREWDKLTEEQKKEAHRNLTGGYVVLDHNHNKTPIPAGFEDFAPKEGE